MWTIVDIYAPSGTWGPWQEIFNVPGYSGKVRFNELQRGDTTLHYEIMFFPDEQGGSVIQEGKPGVPFFTHRTASIRAYGDPYGTDVKLNVGY